MRTYARDGSTRLGIWCCGALRVSWCGLQMCVRTYAKACGLHQSAARTRVKRLKRVLEAQSSNLEPRRSKVNARHPDIPTVQPPLLCGCRRLRRRLLLRPLVRLLQLLQLSQTSLIARMDIISARHLCSSKRLYATTDHHSEQLVYDQLSVSEQFESSRTTDFATARSTALGSRY